MNPRFAALVVLTQAKKKSFEFGSNCHLTIKTHYLSFQLVWQFYLPVLTIVFLHFR